MTRGSGAPGDRSGPPDGPDAAPEGSGRPSLWERLIAPLRSEDAAFRVVVWAAGAAIVLAIVVLTVRALT